MLLFLPPLLVSASHPCSFHLLSPPSLRVSSRSVSSFIFPTQIYKFCSVPAQLSLPCRCLECNALSISIPLCSLHFNSSSYNLWATYPHANTHMHTHAQSVTIPLALIFQQRHSIRQWPCHRLLPGDPDPGSPRLVFTLQHHHQDRGKHSADLKAELALCQPFPGAPFPPSTNSHLTPFTTPAAISREEPGGGGGQKNAEREWK